MAMTMMASDRAASLRARRHAFAVLLALAVIVCGAVQSARAADVPNARTAIALSGAEVRALVQQDFARFDLHYAEHREESRRRLDSLGRQLAERQATGNEMECSNEIYLEAKWLYGYTAYWDSLNRRLDDLAKSLDQPDQEFATRQSPETGLWGACYERPFLKLEATTLALIQLEAMGRAPAFPVHLPPPFDDHAATFERLRSLLVSDVANTGVDNRGELGNIATVAGLIYLKDYIQAYLNNVTGLPRNESGSGIKTLEYRSHFYDYVQAWQDETTGYWGPWYLSEGKSYKSADLSVTFHIISYRRGKVNHWPEIIRTTLAIENEPYPFGWKHPGGPNNHNNYDIVTLFRYGWAHMSPEEKQKAYAKIEDMLQWTLTSSLQDNGSFKTVPSFFSSVGADYYFGVSFLREVGFWDPALRFWTSRDFPQAGAICKRIKARLLAMALKSHESQSALAHLAKSC